MLVTGHLFPFVELKLKRNQIIFHEKNLPWTVFEGVKSKLKSLFFWKRTLASLLMTMRLKLKVQEYYTKSKKNQGKIQAKT